MSECCSCSGRPPGRPPRATVRAVEAELAVTVSGSRARHLEFQEAATGDVDITTADFLLSVGRGVGEKENLSQFEELAGKMGATLSVSRPLVDQGWMPSARQVGQSGKTVKPKVYLALGISGAVQHLAGHEDERHDHRGQHRSRGGHLQRRPLRRGRRPLRGRRGAREARISVEPPPERPSRGSRPGRSRSGTG